MNPLTTILSLAAVSAVVTFTLTDPWWDTPLGTIIQIVILAVIFSVIYLAGINQGIEWEQKKRANIFKLWKNQGW